jgi:hypothetical protein
MRWARSDSLGAARATAIRARSRTAPRPYGTLADQQARFASESKPSSKTPVPKFSYLAILSSSCEAERTSRSPSESRSAAMTFRPLLAASERVWAVQPPPAPSFSHQAMVSSK